MKVGVLQFFSWPGRRVALPTVYERALERIDLMDRTGYDAVWLAEHHFTTYSVCPSVHMMGMHVANRTKNLRIGTAVALSAFYHPLRLAEEVALLDVLSGGRVNWGAGRGFDRTEFTNFGVDDADSYPLFRENFEIVLAALSQERLTYQGRYHSFTDVEVLPKPLQDPLPTWVAASSPEAVVWAGERGHSIMMDPHSSHREIGRKQELYRATLESHGHAFGDRQLPMARLLAVAPTAAEARDIAEQGARWTVGSYANDKNSVATNKATDRRPDQDPIQRYIDEVIIWGSPDQVVDKLNELRETMHLTYLMCSPLSHGTFTLFTEQVLPRVLGA